MNIDAVIALALIFSPVILAGVAMIIAGEW